MPSLKALLLRMSDSLTQKIDALLPQTQCGQCGYGGCLPYAQAIANEGEAINRCPPGGIKTLMALGNLLQRDPAPFVAEFKTASPQLAKVRESECIGCTKCIQACPVDAIVGAAKQLHFVLENECTGCGLCVPPCPVDCIDLLPVASLSYHSDQARQRFQARKQRQENKKNITKNISATTPTLSQTKDTNLDKKAYIQAAVLRAKNKKMHA